MTEEHLTNLKKLFQKYDADQDGTLDVNEMRTMLSDIDKKMTNLPAVSTSIHLSTRKANKDGIIDCSSGKSARSIFSQVFEPISSLC